MPSFSMVRESCWEERSSLPGGPGSCPPWSLSVAHPDIPSSVSGIPVGPG